MAKNNLVKGSFDSLLLCLLENQPMYGYQIIKEIEVRSQGYFQFKEGTLYPALHRLEKALLISSKWQMLPNGRQRRYYYLTEKGRSRLIAEKIRWRDFFAAMKMILKPVKARG